MAATAETLQTSQELETARKLHSVELLRDSLYTDPDTARELYKQACDLEASHIAEVLVGEATDLEVRTNFPFEVYGGQLYALQPKSEVDWLALHGKGLERARAKARENPRFNFYAEIAQTELEEAQAQDELVASGRPGTIFSLSLDGSDVASPWDLVSLGRDPDKKRAYLRASVFDGQKLHLYSCSKDYMEISDAREMYKDFFNIKLPPEVSSIDILKSRVHIDGAENDLVDRIVPRAKRETYQFVLDNEDLLQAHMQGLQTLAERNLPDHDLGDYADRLRFDIMASFKHRFNGQWTQQESLAESVAYAGLVERDAGTRFIGCDTIVSQTNNINEAGYLNAQNSEMGLSRGEFESKFCPNCLPEPKAGKKVKAWRKGERIGCKDCGHVVDVCTNKIVRQGKQSKAKTTSWFW